MEKLSRDIVEIKKTKLLTQMKNVMWEMKHMLYGINVRFSIAEEKIIEPENTYDKSTKSGQEEMKTFWYRISHYK